MADLFISYAREDRPQADALARSLQSMGLDVFWDNEIPPGSTWADFLEGKLKACKVMVVLWSAKSVGSQWVREEARIGRDSGKLIPVMMDGTPPPFGFGELQTADLSGWHGQSDHPGFVKLIGAIRYFTDKPLSPPQPHVPPQQPAWNAQAQQPAWNAQPQQQAYAGAAPAGGGERLSPTGYIQKCLKLYADGKGRAGQAEFWWFFLFGVIVYVGGYIADAVMFGINPYDGQLLMPAFSTVLGLAILCPTFAVMARRLHDAGINGWVAIAAIIPLVAIVFGLIPPNRGPNQYGPATSAA